MARILAAVALSFCSIATIQAQTNFQGITYFPSSPFAFETDSSIRSLGNIKRVGADSVAIVDTWFQDSPTSTAIARDTGLWSLTEVSLERMIDAAHDDGLRVMLKPHVDVRSGQWRAYIDPQDVDGWFASYGNFMNQYAELAQRKNIETLVIGTELNSMEKHRGQWQQLIGEVRDRFDGEIGYAANWDDGGVENSGYENVTWWNELDYIGIDAYFPVGSPDDSSLPTMISDWQQLANSIGQWRTDAGLSQPVVFTEFGIGSHTEGHLRPWENGEVPAMQVQADGYEALLTVMGSQPWWRGGFAWSWEANPNLGGLQDPTLTPQNKPAETVLAEQYGGRPTSLYHPRVLASWEQNVEGRMDGWADKFTAANGRLDDVLTQSEFGATDGSSSLAVTSNDPGDHLAARVFWSRWSGHEAYTTIRNALDNPDNFDIELDVTYRSEDMPADFDFLSLTVAAFTCNDAECEDGAWVQSAPLATVDSGNIKEGTQTVAFSFADFGDLYRDTEWYEFHIGHSTDWETEGTYYVDSLRLVSKISGDTNNDGVLDATDIDVLSQAIVDTRYLPQFDVPGDGVLDNSDRVEWMSIAGTLEGDLDLNGVVEFADFLSLSAAFGRLGGWSDGDFSGDGLVSFPDFLQLSSQFGNEQRASTAPEPNGSGLLVLGLLFLLRAKRRR